MLVQSNRHSLAKANCARDVASVPEPAAVTPQGTTLRPVLEPPSRARGIATNSLPIATADNNDTTIQDLQNSPLQPALNVPSYADGSIYGAQSLHVAGVTSAVTAAPHLQSVTLGSACHPQSANAETSTTTTQESTYDTAQPTHPLQATTALNSATTGSGSVTQNIQNTANLDAQNRVVALGKVNAKTIYSRDIPAEIQMQYLIIEAKLTKGLRRYLERKKKSKKGLTLTLMMLGHNSRNNEPHIVLTCEPKSEPFVRNYLHKDRVEPIWRGEGGKGFKLEIDTMTPQPATLEALQDKSCSFFIEYHHNGRVLVATIGGNVTLCYPNGSSQKYGLTVNHLFDLRRDDDSGDAASFCSNTTSEDSDGSCETNESIVSSSSTISSQDSDTEDRWDIWESVRVAPTSPQQSQGGVTATGDSRRIALGKLVPKTFVSHVARNRDWALIEYVEQPLSKFDVESKPQGHLEVATFDSLEGSMPVSVIYCETAHTGRLNAAPTSTVVPGGSRPVSVYTFSFDEAPVDTGSISGSWIVRGSEHHVQIYGQVVAKDAFGGLHVVPIVDILRDIKRVFRVDMVYLHGHNTVPEEIEGVPVPSSSPRFISSNSKHEDTSCSDNMQMHASEQSHSIRSAVELHTTPGSSQGNPIRAANSQQEQIVDISTLGLGNTLGGVPQAADPPFNSFAKQQELQKGRKRKVLGSGLATVRKKAVDAWLEGYGKPAKRPKTPTGRSRFHRVDSESRASTRSSLSVGSQDAVTDAPTMPTSLSSGTGSIAPMMNEPLDRSPIMPRSHDLEPGTVEETVSTPHQTQEIIVPDTPLFLKLRPGIPTPYDAYIPAPFVSIGTSLDPFKTMFHSSHPGLSIEQLKFHFNRYFGTQGLMKYWIPTALSYPYTFLGTLCLATAFHDVIHDQPLESVQTIALRQEVIHLVGRNMLDPKASVSDHNIMAIIQLIISEVIGREESGLKWHEDGIQKMILQRGGLDKLGLSGRLASTISWVSLANSVLHEQQPRSMYAEYCASNSTRAYQPTATLPESPICCVRAEWVTIPRSKSCTPEARALLRDVKTIIDLFLDEPILSQDNSQAIIGLYDKIINLAEYPPISEIRKTRVLTEHDYKYEAIRITSVLQAVAIIQRVPLSGALSRVANTQKQAMFDDSLSADISSATGPSISSTNSAYSDHFYFPPPAPVLNGSTALLSHLKATIEESNISSCWSDIAGVLLWVCMVAGAASRQSESKICKKYFSALTMRLGVILCFEHAEAINKTMVKMSEVIEALSGEKKIA
ncbi:hypothetical protein FB567DRAFT_471660 [Paraphoma chrysanthemicola]|uniref:Uncharacterized protein n=1 Tax=Paraphoma chrysanthemicola TaxID=798071 RepID=A0A8K0VX34_9PLEO|nr:hypothetical protein FB567DRAFT_471660 [Paraphoma chrysanthemicola]